MLEANLALLERQLSIPCSFVERNLQALCNAGIPTGSSLRISLRTNLRKCCDTGLCLTKRAVIHMVCLSKSAEEADTHFKDISHLAQK